MPRLTTREDFYEYHYKRIISNVLGNQDDDLTGNDAAEYIRNNPSEVGDAFLEDLETWCGLEEAIQEMQDDE